MDMAWLIRHGQSASNAHLPTDCPGSSPLTELGRAQAEFLPGLFPALPDLVVVSPYLRAAQTAEPLLAAHPGLVREQWPVQEFTYLSPETYRGTTMVERRPLVAAYWQRLDPDRADPDGAESFAGFMGRVRAFLDRLGSRPGFTAVFTHGQFMRGVMWQALTGAASAGAAEMEQFHSFRTAFRLPNCAVVGLRRGEGGRWWIERIRTCHVPSDSVSY